MPTNKMERVTKEAYESARKAARVNAENALRCALHRQDVLHIGIPGAVRCLTCNTVFVSISDADAVTCPVCASNNWTCEGAVKSCMPLHMKLRTMLRKKPAMADVANVLNARANASVVRSAMMGIRESRLDGRAPSPAKINLMADVLMKRLSDSATPKVKFNMGMGSYPAPASLITRYAENMRRRFISNYGVTSFRAAKEAYLHFDKDAFDKWVEEKKAAKQEAFIQQIEVALAA